LLLLAFALPALANEERCTELGSDCVCSEPLNMTSFTNPATNYYDPSDTSTGECELDGVAGAAAYHAGTVTASNNATILAALPSGHTVSRVLAGSDGHTGIFNLGRNGSISNTKARIAVRWYQYVSSDFEWGYENSCENAKLTEHDSNSRLTWQTDSAAETNLYFHTYNYLSADGWSPGADCCTSGPSSGGQHTQAKSSFRGKWWRFEVVMTNREGPDFRVQLYGKNVTDDGSEIELIDLWQNGVVDNLTPPGLMSQIQLNGYRQGSCDGFFAWSHILYASWDTDSGQRIGAASEVEGGGGEPPPTPTYLPIRISEAP